MLHHITIRTQALYSKLEVSRLALGTFRNALSRMSNERCGFVVTEGIMDMNFQPRGISDLASQGPATYQSEIEAAEALLRDKDTWNGVKAEAVARMRLQNRFKTGLD